MRHHELEQTRELADAYDRIAELEGRLGTVSNELAKKSGAYDQVAAQAQSRAEELKGVRASLKSAQKDIQLVKDNVLASRASNEGFEESDERQKLRAERERMSRRFRQLEEENASMAQRLAVLSPNTGGNSTQQASLVRGETIDAVQQCMHHLMNALGNEGPSEANRGSPRPQSVDDAVQNLSNVIKAACLQLKEYKTLSSTLDARAAKLSTTIEFERRRCRELRQKAQDLVEENAKVKGELASLESRCTYLKEENVSFNRCIPSLSLSWGVPERILPVVWFGGGGGDGDGASENREKLLSNSLREPVDRGSRSYKVLPVPFHHQMHLVSLVIGCESLETRFMIYRSRCKRKTSVLMSFKCGSQILSIKELSTPRRQRCFTLHGIPHQKKQRSWWLRAARKKLKELRPATT